MLIQEVAKQSGISVRTLHYYDQIGLLHPDEINPAGYRIYREPSLKRLQQILFYRELDFPLARIKQLLDNPNLDQTAQMEQQLTLLRLKQARLERIISLLEQQMKGQDNMSIKEFNMDEIRAHQAKYQAEVEAQYGDSQAYQESTRRSANYTEDEWRKIHAEWENIYHALAQRIGTDPAEPETQALVKQWQDLISRYFYPCNDQMLAGLGEMYQADESFRANIDQYGAGLTDFLSAAIKHYTS